MRPVTVGAARGIHPKTLPRLLVAIVPKMVVGLSAGTKVTNCALRTVVMGIKTVTLAWVEPFKYTVPVESSRMMGTLL